VLRPVEPDTDSGRRCLAAGHDSSELWLCLGCGWVSSSERPHGPPASEHYAETDHPIAAPLTGPPGVRWCFIDKRFV
jgi:uncharacterized UBP type Zn finger protein